MPRTPEHPEVDPAEVSKEAIKSDLTDESLIHPILSPAEVKEAKAAARKQLEDERHKDALERLKAAEIVRLRMDEGIVTGGPMNEMVEITIDLPDWAPYLSTNMVPYWHGHTYKIARHIAADLAWRMQAAWLHEDQVIRGKNMREAYQGRHNTQISPVRGTKNAPQHPTGATVQ